MFDALCIVRRHAVRRGNIFLLRLHTFFFIFVAFFNVFLFLFERFYIYDRMCHADYVNACVVTRLVEI